MKSKIQQGDAITRRYKMTTDMPAGILTPDTVETRLGTLRFFDGFPDEVTVQKVFDNLDFQRAVQAFLTTLPVAEAYAMRTGIRTFSPDNQTALITETLTDSHILAGLPNPDTVYTWLWLDTKGGPLVIEVPPRVLGFINDFWGRYVATWATPGQIKARVANTCCSRQATRARSPTATSSCPPPPTGTVCCFGAI